MLVTRAAPLVERAGCGLLVGSYPMLDQAARDGSVSAVLFGSNAMRTAAIKTLNF